MKRILEKKNNAALKREKKSKSMQGKTNTITYTNAQGVQIHSYGGG
jgi:hypothetical protein